MLILLSIYWQNRAICSESHICFSYFWYLSFIILVGSKYFQTYQSLESNVQNENIFKYTNAQNQMLRTKISFLNLYFFSIDKPLLFSYQDFFLNPCFNVIHWTWELDIMPYIIYFGLSCDTFYGWLVVLGVQDCSFGVKGKFYVLTSIDGDPIVVPMVSIFQRPVLDRLTLKTGITIRHSQASLEQS